jgi:hypothetical protein
MIVSDLRPYLTAPACRSAFAARVTVGRSVPSMIARKSWVSLTISELIRSRDIRSQRASRCFASCRRLQAAVCPICIAFTMEYLRTRSRSPGEPFIASSNALLFTLKPLPAICTRTCAVVRWRPAASAIPVSPSHQRFQLQHSCLARLPRSETPGHY